MSLYTTTQIQAVIVVVPCMISRFLPCADTACEMCKGNGEYQKAMPFEDFVALVNDHNHSSKNHNHSSEE